MEREHGMDPEIKQFFKRIINTLSYGLLWLITVVAAGIYFRLGWHEDKPVVYTFLFYIAAAVSLFFLLRYYYQLWRKQ